MGPKVALPVRRSARIVTGRRGFACSTPVSRPYLTRRGAVRHSRAARCSSPTSYREPKLPHRAHPARPAWRSPASVPTLVRGEEVVCWKYCTTTSRTGDKTVGEDLTLNCFIFFDQSTCFPPKIAGAPAFAWTLMAAATRHVTVTHPSSAAPVRERIDRPAILPAAGSSMEVDFKTVTLKVDTLKHRNQAI